MKPLTAQPSRGRAMNALSVLLLIVGIVLVAWCARALLKANREHRRDELRSISVDVLRETGDSLAQRLEQARRTEEERAAGEMSRRAEESKGIARPVEEELGRMESENGRLQRE